MHDDGIVDHDPADGQAGRSGHDQVDRAKRQPRSGGYWKLVGCGVSLDDGELGAEGTQALLEHPQLLIEAVRQLRGECGERQVAGVKVALAHGNGGTLSSQVTVLLGTSQTL